MIKQDRFLKNLLPKHDLPETVVKFAGELKENKIDPNNVKVKLPEGYEEEEVTLNAHEAFAYLSTVYLHSLHIIQYMESHDEAVPEDHFQRFTALGLILDDIGPGTTDRLTAESMSDDLEIPTFVREQIQIFLAITHLSRKLTSRRMKPARIKNKLHQAFENRLKAYAKTIPPVPSAFQNLIPFNLLEY